MERKAKAGLTLLFAAMLLIPFATILTANSQATRYGPKIDNLRFRVIKSPDAQTLAMVRREIDILTGMIRPVDIETLSRAGRTILSMPGDHFCYMCFNMRNQRSSTPPKNLPFGLQNGGEPGRSLRHAIAHLVPKAVLIGSLFKYVNTQIEVPMSASLGTFGADIDTHPYDPIMARNILLAAGWTWDGSDWHVPASVPVGYPLPGGSVLPTLDFMSPTLEAAPTSWTIAETTAQNMRDIGIKVDHTEYDLTTLIDMINAGNFEMFFLCWTNMGRFGDHLYDFFHSSQDVAEGYNRNGLRNATYDAVALALYTTLSKTFMEQKVAEALELLMGTSQYQNTPLTDGIIPYIPIYSRTYYDGWDEYLLGMANAKLSGSWNGWTRDNMYWTAGHERYSDLPTSVLPAGSTMVIFCQGEDYQYPANPVWASSAVTWDQIEACYDGLIGLNGYNLKDKPGWLDLTRDPDPTTTPGYTIIPWTVTDGPAAGNNGMKVTFYLNDTARDWHDGHQIDAYDFVFQWEYMTVNKIMRGWGTFMYFHHAVVEDYRTITAYMTTTGLTIPYGLSAWSDLCPEHIWGCTHSRGGRATASCVSGTAHERTNAWNSMVSHINSGPVPGSAGNKLVSDPDATAESGLCLCAVGTQGAGGKLTCVHGSGCVIDDWTTPENEILDYNPAAYAHATASYPWLTEQVGTGPWIFYDINVAAGTANLIAFSGADHYPQMNSEMHNQMVEYFWELGDVDLNGEIRVVYDLAIQGANYFKPVPPAPSRADINKDGIVDIRDMSYGGLNYGEEREVLP